MATKKTSVWKNHDAVLKVLRQRGVLPYAIKHQPSVVRSKLKSVYASSRVEAFIRFIEGKSLASIQTRSYVLEATDPGSVWSKDPRRDKALRILRNKGMTPRWIKRQQEKVVKFLIEAKFKDEVARELALFFAKLKPKQLSGRCRHLGKGTKPARWTKLRQALLKILKKAAMNPRQMIANRKRVIEVLTKAGRPEKTAELFADFLAKRTPISIQAACNKYRALAELPGWDDEKIRALSVLRKKGMGCAVISGNSPGVEAALLAQGFAPDRASSLATFLASKTRGALATQCKDHGLADPSRSKKIKNGINEMKMNDEQHEIMLTFIRERLGVSDYHLIAKEWNKTYPKQGFPKLNYERVHRFVKNKLRSVKPTRSQTYMMPSTQARRKRMAKKKK